MQPLIDHINSHASCVAMDLTDPLWYSRWDIPSTPGWYFIRTDAPLEVLRRQNRWIDTYVTKKKGEIRMTKNYNIAARASRYTDELDAYWNTGEVYSGMASNLRGRAGEHTLPDPGTAGLALGRYPELARYNWIFGFIRLDRFGTSSAGRAMLLRLGEQVWRARNGWPLLCSE